MLISTRRRFLQGCSTAIAAMTGSRLGYLGVADGQSVESLAGDNRETLVLVFLRGGMDGLSLIPPRAGEDREHYEAARPLLRIPLSGEGALLPLDDRFGLHPSAEPLLPLFQSGHLAIVHAVGAAGSRSHFEAMKEIELGTPGVKSTPEGWLTRHLRSTPNLPATVPVPAVSAGGTPPTSLKGNDELVNLVQPASFQLGSIGHASWAAGEQWAALRRMYRLGTSPVHVAGVQALNAVGLMESHLQAGAVPPGGAAYPGSHFGQHLRLVAQLIRAEVGLRVATVDLGGWDTHDNQGNRPGGYFSGIVNQLAAGLAAFYADLDGSGSDAPIRRVTVVVMSEFGRRIRENANQGTDHGTANAVLVLGGNVRGGFHGQWPGLHPDQRFDHADLAPTTDLRQVLSEILIRRAGNPHLGEVFPRYDGYAPLGVVTGPDLPPEYGGLPAEMPGGFEAVWAGASGIRLTWGSAAHATNYRLERRFTAQDDWQHLVVLGAGSLQYEDRTVPEEASPAYRLQAFNSHGASDFVETTVQTGLEPRAQWRQTHFGTSDDGGAAADGAVASEDGLPNLVKYALGLDPHVPAVAPTTGFLPGRPRTERDAGMLSMVYVRPLDRTDVEYAVLSSTDLQGWTPVQEVSEGVADGMERRRATVTLADGDRWFLKLTVRSR